MVNSFVGWVPIGIIIDAILFGSALLAIAAARFLPEHHLSPETKGAVTGIGGHCWNAFGAGSRSSHIHLQRILHGQIPTGYADIGGCDQPGPHAPTLWARGAGQPHTVTGYWSLCARWPPYATPSFVRIQTLAFRDAAKIMARVASARSGAAPTGVQKYRHKERAMRDRSHGRNRVRLTKADYWRYWF